MGGYHLLVGRNPTAGKLLRSRLLAGTVATATKDVGGFRAAFTIGTAIIAILLGVAAATRMGALLLVFHTPGGALRAPKLAGDFRHNELGRPARACEARLFSTALPKILAYIGRWGTGPRDRQASANSQCDGRHFASTLWIAEVTAMTIRGHLTVYR